MDQRNMTHPACTLRFFIFVLNTKHARDLLFENNTPARKIYGFIQSTRPKPSGSQH
ncbi:hypothetical protein PtrM4_023640 [Pyrenophora tritici-repentis]|uniref:Uncharacterized protein n=1 Tax=Pyrenophora tritici-repentis TaxID=45151 RepID=A0A317A188_9PLEO|nr:hypothetical protein PtrM4_023640 [Pyrenophora tritici-repentis]KAI0571255.1 hypothetical protein Alg215_10522 [Pyrenophora tritici-repentis]KAI1518165.1 hypothetical protein Ptr86124_003466 [Pyrenophora tritici-repentis]KAI1525838.1 hypothetical protein PtrSN001C_010476 [Pyrenophora tritici-repentis]KAI1673897.1 hypothetical protein L13192_00644 [Pyrenophora tritici-repentis]